MTVIRNNRVLWTIQILLAALYLFAGGVKLFASAAMLTSQPGPQLPIFLLRFVGLMEVLGALGLILPGLTGIQPQLTALAAAGLVVIMIGATVISAMTLGISSAILPFVAGVLAATVAYGRRQTVRRQYSTTA